MRPDGMAALIFPESSPRRKSTIIDMFPMLYFLLRPRADYQSAVNFLYLGCHPIALHRVSYRAL